MRESSYELSETIPVMFTVRSAVVLMLCTLAVTALQPVSAQQGHPPNESPVVFRDILSNEPIKFTYRPDQELTPAVREFHRTAKNPYSDEKAAISDGQVLYQQYCQPCHLSEGTGRLGPSLVDDEWTEPRVSTDKGMFEIIYAGGAGAMQAFGRRIDQDQILKVMAYIESLRKN